MSEQPFAAPQSQPAGSPEDRLAALEQLFREQAAQIEAEREQAKANLAAQEAKNEELAAQLRQALARPEKLKTPGKFVGREGAPDSPVEDHYSLVLATGEVVRTVHPTATHVAVGNDLVPVIRVFHDNDIHAAQHAEAA